MADDTETGMMIMKMDEGLDTGPVAMTEKVAIGPDMTAGELHDALSQRGASLMVRAMAALEQGVLELVPQPDDGVTYAAKIAKDETRVDWAGDGADIHNHIRGLSPFPGAWCEMRFGGKWERVKLLASTQAPGSGKPGAPIVGAPITVACGTGAVRLTRLQKAGGRPLDAETFLRGNPLATGDIR
jgi:methionyl-tRNA formyltransferase